MVFHDVRLPDNVERGAQGGPGFNTTILTLSSGFEKRNINWERSRGQWDVGYGIDDKAAQQVVLGFFYARQGRANSFRFKDWTDFEIGVDSTDTEQDIAIADGVQQQFQIVRRYVSGPTTFDRAVTRPVSGTVRVFLGGVEQFAGFTVDNNTGVISFTVAPILSTVVGVIAEFDNPVRFDDDQLAIRALTSDAMSIPGIPVIEVREDLVVLS